MKNILIYLILIPVFSFSQNARFGKITSKEELTQYITKNNTTIKVGDKIIIGLPSAPTQFVFITQGGKTTTPNLAFNIITVQKIVTIGTDKTGYKAYIRLKNYGLVPLLIDIEPAIQSKEILLYQ